MITLDEYVAQMRVELEQFENHWQKMMKKKPQFFPNQMYWGEWDEQFTFFSDGDTSTDEDG